MLGFGIGSLFPQLKDPDSYRSWADEVERVFNLIPSIDNLQINGGRSSSILFNTEGAEMLDDLIHHPIPVNGAISFTLTIPSRVQDRLNPLWKTSKENKIEKFFVVMELEWDYPYTWVMISGDDIIRPSGAVVVVREFLLEELEKLGDRSSLTLTTLGPSPFHTDFLVKEGDQGEATGEVVTPGIKMSMQRDRRRYTLCEFFYDPAEFETSAHAVDSIRRRIGAEFACFYGLVAAKTVKEFKVQVLTFQVEGAVSTYRTKGLKNWLYRVWTSRSNLRNIGLELLEIQMEITRTQQANNKNIETLSADQGPLIFKGELNEESELDYSNELDNLGAMLKILESQHTQTVQRLTAFAVSILGVMVGAFLTAALRR